MTEKLRCHLFLQWRNLIWGWEFNYIGLNCLAIFGRLLVYSTEQPFDSPKRKPPPSKLDPNGDETNGFVELNKQYKDAKIRHEAREREREQKNPKRLKCAQKAKHRLRCCWLTTPITSSFPFFVCVYVFCALLHPWDANVLKPRTRRLLYIIYIFIALFYFHLVHTLAQISIPVLAHSLLLLFGDGVGDSLRTKKGTRSFRLGFIAKLEAIFRWSFVNWALSANVPTKI